MLSSLVLLLAAFAPSAALVMPSLPAMHVTRASHAHAVVMQAIDDEGNSVQEIATGGMSFDEYAAQAGMAEAVRL